MTDKDIFNTPQEEIQRLAEEIHGVKGILHDLSRTLSQLEVRVKRAFPSVYPEIKPLKKEGRPLGINGKPSMTAEDALHLYDELVSQARNGETKPVYDRLSAMNIANLSVMRQELGISLGKKKPSIKTLVEAIMGRINQSIMLSKHTNREKVIETTPELIAQPVNK